MLRKKHGHPDLTRAWDLPDNALSSALREFLDWSGVHGLAATSLHQRSRALRRFILWLTERAIAHPQELTLPIIERYQRHLFHHRKSDGNPLTLCFQTQELLPIRAWCKWLVRERRILYNPASELLLPRASKRLPRFVLTIEEVEAVIGGADVTQAAGLRDRAMMEVFYSSGLRRTELTRLKLEDVDTQRGSILVREGKGARDRWVPLGARACAWVDKYRREARDALLAMHDDGSLFLTDYGSPWHPDTLGNLIKRYLQAAGITATGSCHLFRHACATHMLEGGADIRFIQAILGHADLNSTEIYTHVSIRKLQEIHAATHPARLHVNEHASEDASEHANTNANEPVRSAQADAQTGADARPQSETENAASATIAALQVKGEAGDVR